MNPDTSLVALAKALDDELSVIEAEEKHKLAEQATKAMTSAPASAAPATAGAAPGSGRPVVPQSLAHSPTKTSKKFSRPEAVTWMRSRYPHISEATAGRLVALSFAMRDSAGGST